MPELPEVEVCCRELDASVVGLRMGSPTIRKRSLRTPVPPGFEKGVEGRTVVSVRRRGKWMVFSLDDGGVMLVHFGMTGRLLVLPSGTPPEKHSHADIPLSDGRMLRYEDPRRFGALVYYPMGDRVKELEVLGKEPLEEGFDGGFLHALFSGRKSPVKPVLMNAALLVGVGNIYASEALFLSGISPERPCLSLSRDECDVLASRIRSVLEESIASGGTSFRDYVHSDGGKGGFAQQCKVFGRAGHPCLVCGTEIVRSVQSGRSTFSCPVCQR